MDPIARMVAAGAAGAAGSGPGLYVDDVFSTYLYEGTNSAKTITNGIDLSGEGGLVWIKSRSQARESFLFDTERGARKRLRSELSAAEQDTTTTYGLQSFTSSGFTLVENWGGENESGADHCSWTFRKAPGFFDVVTWSGNSTTGRQISHNLGSTPGMILIKNINSTYNWVVYHRSEGASKYAHLNSTNAFASASGDYNYFNGTEPTSTHFTVDSGNASARVNVNDFGSTYVAYLFAHDDQSFGTSGSEAIIKCGSYTGNGSETGNVIDLGFEPQWLMIKRASDTDPWLIWDTMRGMINEKTPGTTGAQDPYLKPNTSDAEDVFAGVDVLPTGFELTSSTGFQNSSGQTYIYMAIRRPHKPPEAGTDVFAIDTKTASSTNTPSYTSNFPVDLALRRDNRFSTNDSFEFISRLTNGILYANQTNAEQSGGATVLDYFAYNNGWASINGNDSNDYLWMFRRAPGFFDVVTYTGTGSNQTVNHNLQAVPELIIVKKRSASNFWSTFVNGVTSPNSNWYQNAMYINSDSAASGFAGAFSSAPTSTALPFGSGTNVGASGATYVAYLFATRSGISKVGTYSGNSGYDVNVDCGFSAGARFVLIKRTDSTGDWYVWDTARGIVSGNDPYLLLNSNAAEVTNTDYIDPLNAGFTVTSSAPAALNTSGGTYLFLAIA